MKYLKHIALAIILGAIFTISAYADGKPNGNHDNGGGFGKFTNYGLSDSCWNVFLGQLSASDAAKLSADQKTISGDQAQIDTLTQQIFTLLKNATGKRDSTTRVKVEALEQQIVTLQKASGAAQIDIDSILKTNSALFETIEENCGKHEDGGHGDTTKGHGDPTPPNTGGKGHFGLSDSCWNIFLSQVSPADTAQLAADLKILASDQLQIDTLLKQIRAIKGSLKDSTVRAEYKALLAQINVIVKASETAEKDYASIIKKYGTILQSIRQDCGRHTHKGNAGDPTNGLTVGDIVPNPATVGSSASLTITLTADAEVFITVGSAIAQGPPVKVIFNGALTAGTHTQALDLTGFGAGVYIVTIQSGNAIVARKLVLQ